uniref:Uncharacterized protein n=1 Tax=Salmonella phage vB_STmST313_KE27 TaxID=3161178 RepID=A0AAU8GHC1_9CAUD
MKHFAPVVYLFQVLHNKVKLRISGVSLLSYLALMEH